MQLDKTALNRVLVQFQRNPFVLIDFLRRAGPGLAFPGYRLGPCLWGVCVPSNAASFEFRGNQRKQKRRDESYLHEISVSLKLPRNLMIPWQSIA